MSDIRNVDSMAAIKLLLKRENYNHLADVFSNLIDAARTPGPNLGADEIEDRNGDSVQLARQAQIEIRKVDQDRGPGPALLCFSDYVFKLAANGRKMSNHFSQANHSHFAGVYKKFTSGNAHFVATHAKKSCFGRELLQCLNELSAVVFSGGFPGGDEKGFSRLR